MLDGLQWQLLETCFYSASGKPRGIRTARKLTNHRRDQKWHDKDYKKAHLPSRWVKPFQGSSHAKGIVLEKVWVFSIYRLHSGSELQISWVFRQVCFLNVCRGWLGEAKVSCILCHRVIQLILAYSWTGPAVFAAGNGRGGMFLFLLFLLIYLFSFLPCSSLWSLLSFSGRRHKMTHKGWHVIKP